MEKNIPTYKISDDQALSENGEFMGISEVAYTSNPAIILKGVAFDAAKPSKEMRFADALKMRVAAPALIPNIPIYRKDNELGEYNVVFTQERVDSLFRNFMKTHGSKPFNLDHTSAKTDSYILEIWQVSQDPKTDRSFMEYGIECPAGSIFIVSQFEDPEYFQKEIIEKGRTGYSIEGFLGLELAQIIKDKYMKKEKLEAVRKADGNEVFINGEIAVDSEVYCNEPSYVLINGEKSEMKYPYYGDVIELEDGQILIMANSKIVEITQKEQFKKTKMEKQKFEKQILEDGTPVFISNGEAFIIDDNGDKAPIFDGEHKLKDGSIIATVGGKITEKETEAPIEAAKTEEKPVEEKPVACAESPIPAVSEEKKDEEKMADAPVAEKPADAPVATPDEAAILAVVQPKLDELMKAIADLKTLVETSDVPVDVEMNKAKFTNVAKPTGVDTLASFFKNVDKN